MHSLSCSLVQFTSVVVWWTWFTAGLLPDMQPVSRRCSGHWPHVQRTITNKKCMETNEQLVWNSGPWDQTDDLHFTKLPTTTILNCSTLIMGGHQTSAISFHSSHCGKLFYCFLMQKHCSFCDVYKIGFIHVMISVSVHMTFKFVKIMHLNFYFSYWPHP